MHHQTMDDSNGIIAILIVNVFFFHFLSFARSFTQRQELANFVSSFRFGPSSGSFNLFYSISFRQAADFMQRYPSPK